MNNPNLEVIYTGADGTKYYHFPNLADIPMKRFHSAQVEEKYLTFGFTKAYGDKIIALGKSLAFDGSRSDKQKIQDMYQVFLNMEQRLGYISSEEHYLRLAAIYYLIDDEPEGEVVEAFTMKKIKLWSEDPAAKDFFIQRVFQAIAGSANIALEQIKSYLEIAEARQQTIPTLPVI